MTLIISSRAPGFINYYRDVYWSRTTAYNDILGAEDVSDEHKRTIRENRDTAEKILDDWVWSFASRYVRYVLPTEWNNANRRYYRSFPEAALALVNEIRCMAKFKLEAEKAAELLGADGMGGGAFRQAFRSGIAKVFKFVDEETTYGIKRACEAQRGSYKDYYAGLFSATDIGSRSCYLALKRLAADKIQGHTIAACVGVLHDVSVCGKSKLPKRGVGGASTSSGGGGPWDAGTMKVTIPDEGGQTVASLSDIKQRWTRKYSSSGWVDDRTPDESHPAVKAAREQGYMVQMGPSRTTAHYLNLLANAGCSKLEMEQMALGLFAFWNQVYNRRCTMIHCYYFVADCAKHNFGLDLDPLGDVTL